MVKMSTVEFRKAGFSLSVSDLIRLHMGGCVQVGFYELNENKPNKPKSAIYAAKCPEHGVVANYVKGHSERIECPTCWLQTVKI